MCGRYVRRSDKQKIAEFFHANPQPAELPMPGADYNIAPTTFQPIIRQSRESGEREMVLARWGLVPFFTKDLKDIKGLSTINARAESIRRVSANCWGLHRDLKSLEFEHKARGPFGFGMSLKLQGSPLPAIQHYGERQLETEVVCDRCTLRYAIYGVFGWCPDCGVHNSVQILTKNLEIARKKLTLAESLEKDLAETLIGDALESVVAAFDGFGRQVCAQKGQEIRFQNLAGAKRQVQSAFGFDFTDALQPGEWEQTFRYFQKRHLLAHKMGVVDEDYLQKTSDPAAVLGRKISVKPAEVSALMVTVEQLGRRLYDGVFHVS